MSRFSELLRKRRNELGNKFDASDLECVCPAILEAFESGQRVRLSRDGGQTYSDGYIGNTTGWKPCFLLVHNRRSLGSSYCIDQRDSVIKKFNTFRHK